MIAAEELAHAQRRFSRPAEAIDGRKARSVGRRVRTDPRALYLACLLLCAALAFTLTARSLAAVNEGYRLGALKAQLAQLQREREGLQLELARAQSLDRIRAVATTKLKMKEPDRFRFASVTNAADSNAYGFRTDLPGGSQVAKAPAAADSSPKPALVAVTNSGRRLSDVAHRVLRWLTTMRQARADGWD